MEKKFIDPGKLKLSLLYVTGFCFEVAVLLKNFSVWKGDLINWSRFCLICFSNFYVLNLMGVLSGLKEILIG